MSRIAFFTYGILREAKGHEQVQGIFDRFEATFSQLEKSEGFIDRDRGEWGDRLSPRFFDRDKHVADLLTLSLWTDLESVSAFAYRGPHGEAFKRRREWVLKPEWPSYVAWWVDADHTPDCEEACQRLEYLHDHGPSDQAFNFKQPFDENGQAVELDRIRLHQRIKDNEVHAG